MNLLDLYEMRDPRDAYQRDVYNSRVGMNRQSRADVTGEEEPSGVFTVVIDGKPWKTGSSNEMFALAGRIANKHTDKKVSVKWPTGELNTVRPQGVAEASDQSNAISQEQLNQMYANAKPMMFIKNTPVALVPLAKINQIGTPQQVQQVQQALGSVDQTSYTDEYKNKGYVVFQWNGTALDLYVASPEVVSQKYVKFSGQLPQDEKSRGKIPSLVALSKLGIDPSKVPFFVKKVPNEMVSAKQLGLEGKTIQVFWGSDPSTQEVAPGGFLTKNEHGMIYTIAPDAQGLPIGYLPAQQGMAEGSLEEGVNDPHIFKAIAMIGPMGAGKSTIARQLVGGSGLRSLNLDNFNELLIKQGKVVGGNLTPDQLERSWQLTQAQKGNWVDGRLGLLIDGSGRNVEGLVKPLLQLEALGYDTMVILVNVSLETSLQRQQSRAAQQAQQYGTGRNVPADLAKSSYDQIQQNIPKLQQLYGNKLLIINNEGAVDLTQEKTIVDRFLSAPPSKPAAVEWIKSHGASQGQQLDKRLAQQQRQQSSAQRAPTYTQQGVAEGHTEVKDKQGKVVSWKDDSEWHRAEKNKQGQPKDPRGVVTHLSDIARRKTAKQQDMAEVDSDGYSMDHADSGEYDYEGDQARDQMNTIVRAARRLNGMLDDNENMPEWVQMKVTLAADYLDTAADYIESNQEPELAEDNHDDLDNHPDNPKNWGGDHNDQAMWDEKHGVAEGERGRGRPPSGEQDTTPVTPGRVEKTATGIRHHADASRYGGTEPDAEDDYLMSKSHISRLGKMTEPDIDEGWRETLGTVALTSAMALGAGGAQARVMPGDDPGINRLTGKPIATQQATDTAPTQSTSSINLAKPQAQYDVDTRILTYKGKQYKWNSDAQATGQGEVVTAPSIAVGSRSMGSTKVELNPNGTYTRAPANESQEKIGNMDADEFDSAMARLKQLAGAGPMKTVYDPAKRVYRNVPVAVQPKK